MSAPTTFEHIHRLNAETFANLGPDERYGEVMARSDNVADVCMNYIQTPPGSGSPRGMHTHPYDQIFYIVSGVMDVEIEGVGHFRLNPGDVSITPAKVPHRNWNDGDVPVIHLSINTALPEGESAE